MQCTGTLKWNKWLLIQNNGWPGTDWHCFEDPFKCQDWKNLLVSVADGNKCLHRAWNQSWVTWPTTLWRLTSTEWRHAVLLVSVWKADLILSNAIIYKSTKTCVWCTWSWWIHNIYCNKQIFKNTKYLLIIASWLFWLWQHFNQIILNGGIYLFRPQVTITVYALSTRRQLYTSNEPSNSTLAASVPGPWWATNTWKWRTLQLLSKPTGQTEYVKLNLHVRWISQYLVQYVNNLAFIYLFTMT